MLAIEDLNRTDSVFGYKRSDIGSYPGIRTVCAWQQRDSPWCLRGPGDVRWGVSHALAAIMSIPALNDLAPHVTIVATRITCSSVVVVQRLAVRVDAPDRRQLFRVRTEACTCEDQECLC